MKQNFYVYVKRDIRERIFFMIAKQLTSVSANLVVQIGTIKILQQYGKDHLILVNICEHCFKTNMDLASLCNTSYPNVELTMFIVLSIIFPVKVALRVKI